MREAACSMVLVAASQYRRDASRQLPSRNCPCAFSNLGDNARLTLVSIIILLVYNHSDADVSGVAECLAFDLRKAPTASMKSSADAAAAATFSGRS